MDTMDEISIDELTIKSESYLNGYKDGYKTAIINTYEKAFNEGVTFAESNFIKKNAVDSYNNIVENMLNMLAKTYSTEPKNIEATVSKNKTKKNPTADCSVGFLFEHPDK